MIKSCESTHVVVGRQSFRRELAMVGRGMARRCEGRWYTCGSVGEQSTSFQLAGKCDFEGLKSNAVQGAVQERRELRCGALDQRPECVRRLTFQNSALFVVRVSESSRASTSDLLVPLPLIE